MLHALRIRIHNPVGAVVTYSNRSYIRIWRCSRGRIVGVCRAIGSVDGGWHESALLVTWSLDPADGGVRCGVSGESHLLHLSGPVPGPVPPRTNSQLVPATGPRPHDRRLSHGSRHPAIRPRVSSTSRIPSLEPRTSNLPTYGGQLSSSLPLLFLPSSFPSPPPHPAFSSCRMSLPAPPAPPPLRHRMDGAALGACALVLAWIQVFRRLESCQ
jgi:hypothetical protein